MPIVGHAFRILDVFCDADASFTLQEIAVLSKVTKSSTFRILYTLENLGYISRDDKGKKYRLGLKLFEAAEKARPSRSVVQVAMPYLKQLFEAFNETVNLAEYRSNGVYFIEILESSHPFRMTAQVGGKSECHAAAIGKSVAAFLPREALNVLLADGRLPKLTNRTITSRSVLLRHLAKVRRQGFAFDDEEVERGAFCVGVPILTDGVHATHALSVSGPTPRIRARRKEIIRDLLRVATAISVELQKQRTNGSPRRA